MASMLKSTRRIPRLSSSSAWRSQCATPVAVRYISRAHAHAQLPRPPPPTQQPIVEIFNGPSRPRPYYAKHPPFKTRELPRPTKTWPYMLAAGLFCTSLGYLFMKHVTNQEMLSSSVFRSIVRSVKEDPELKEHLGEAIRPQAEWWLNGDPSVTGHINQLAGNIDVSFRIRGSKGSGTLYFTSIRKEKGVPFTIIRFKVICDDGAVVHVNASPV